MRGLVGLALVVAAKGDCRLGALNTALADLLTDEPLLEVHLVTDAEGRLDAPPPPSVTLHRLPRAASVFQLWGHGLSQARADYVAVLDVHCPPKAGWLAAIRAALESRAEAMFGPVEPAYGWQDRRMIGYLAEYVQFHRPLAAGMDEVAGNNLVFRRDLAGSAPALTEQGFVKTRWMAGLAERPLLVPDAVIAHAKPMDFGAYCRRRHAHGRAYGAQRSLTDPGRIVAALKCLPLPALRLARILKHSARQGATLAAFFRFAPHMLIAETAWSAGELTGYLTGKAGAAEDID